MLPLPANWSIEANSDAVTLSIKLMMSTLLTESFEDYVQGNKGALDALTKNLNSTVAALSEFLFAQTKIKIRKRNLSRGGASTGMSDNDTKNLRVSRGLKTKVTNVEIGSIDIAASLKQTPTPLQRASRTPTASLFEDNNDSGDALNKTNIGCDKDYQMRPYQMKLIRNLIQLFMEEVHFIEELQNSLELGYDLKQRLPFEWNIHPRYVLREENGESRVFYRFYLYILFSLPKHYYKNTKS